MWGSCVKITSLQQKKLHKVFEKLKTRDSRRPAVNKIQFKTFPNLNVLETTIVFKPKCTPTHGRYTNNYITEAGIAGGLGNTKKLGFEHLSSQLRVNI